MHHQLKIHIQYFEPLLLEIKNCEIRINDRNYKRGDTLSFIVYWDNGDTSEEPYVWTVTHVLTYPNGLKDGYVCLSLEME